MTNSWISHSRGSHPMDPEPQCGMPSPVPGEPHLDRKAAFIIAVSSLDIVTPRIRSAKISPAMGCFPPLGLSSVSKTYDQRTIQRANAPAQHVKCRSPRSPPLISLDEVGGSSHWKGRMQLETMGFWKSVSKMVIMYSLHSIRNILHRSTRTWPAPYSVHPVQPSQKRTSY
jgi:hypothetical protein